MSVGAGAATGVASTYAISAVPFLGQAWWTMPAAMAVVGHFLKRKYPAIGGALLGIAGYWGYNTYLQQRGGTAKGLEGGDAGALVRYNEGIATAAAPALETAQAAALMGGGMGGAMGFVDAGDISDAYGLEG